MVAAHPGATPDSSAAAAQSPPPAPQPDVESAPFWEALRRHRVLLQRCTACGRIRFPPMPACPYCGGRTSVAEEVAATGRIYSFVRVHRALTPSMSGQVPYVVAVVQLDAGPRMIGRVDGDQESVVIDAAVRPDFVDHDGWTELRFALVDAAGSAP
jgi:uncharacterized OB-fold protein